MRKLLKKLYEAYEQRLVKQLAEVQHQATSEAYEMFPLWWEQRALNIVDAGAHRHHDGTLDDTGLEMTRAVVRNCGLKLAVHVRIQSASTRWAQRSVPRIWGLRASVVEGLKEEAEDITAMFHIIAGYGINPTWLRSHFAA